MLLTETVAKALQEALELSHTDICKTLADELGDMYPGEYAYVCDVFGDAKSGEVVYYCSGETWKAPYEIGEVNGKRTCAIDDDEAVEVMQRTVYDEEADEADVYSSMGEAFKQAKLYTDLPVYERFISKKERDAMDSGDFAGKGKSFPIKTSADVDAAFHSLGRAGSDNYSTAVIRANIIKIAKRKGLKLPKSAQETKESAQVAGAELKLCEGAADFLKEITLTEARANYPIKLISPGTGTTAHYPAAVLERDGPKVFKAGTLMFWNHPTRAEEAARPEGNLDNLAAITTSDARWETSGVKGPGLYAEAKVMADYSQKVEERAPHIGLSIRAGGKASGREVDGKPELASIEYAESVDYVTRAGRGGLALAEAAKYAGLLPNEGGDMTPEEAKKLIEAGIAAANKPLLERLQRADAKEEAVRLLEGVTLPNETKARVVDRVLTAIPLTEAGAIDQKKLDELVVAEAKAEGEYLAKVTGSGRVFGMGVGTAVVERDPEKERKRLKEAKRERKETLREAEQIWAGFGLTEEQAKIAARGREEVA